MALKQATVPFFGCARVSGFPWSVALIEPPTGIDDSLARAPEGGVAEFDVLAELDSAEWLLSGCDCDGEGSCVRVACSLLGCSLLLCSVLGCLLLECSVLGCLLADSLAVDRDASLRLGTTVDVGDGLKVALEVPLDAVPPTVEPAAEQPLSASTATPATPTPPASSARRLTSDPCAMARFLRRRSPWRRTASRRHSHQRTEGPCRFNDSRPRSRGELVVGVSSRDDTAVRGDERP